MILYQKEPVAAPGDITMNCFAVDYERNMGEETKCRNIFLEGCSLQSPLEGDSVQYPLEGYKFNHEKTSLELHKDVFSISLIRIIHPHLPQPFLGSSTAGIKHHRTLVFLFGSKGNTFLFVIVS